MLDSFLPGISAENASRILLRRNMEAANRMKSMMEQGSKKRQQRILSSMREGDDSE